MSVKNVLWRAFIPYCTDSMLCDPKCRWNRLKVVASLVSEVSDRTQSILNSVIGLLYYESRCDSVWLEMLACCN